MRTAALAFFSFGLAFIALLAYSAEPRQVLLGELEENAGRLVQVEGRVLSVSNGTHSFVALDDGSGNATAVFFNRKVDAAEGGWLCVVGKAALYGGETEVVGERTC